MTVRPIIIKSFSVYYIYVLTVVPTGRKWPFYNSREWAPVGEISLPMLSQLISSGASFQAVYFWNQT